MPGLVLAWSLQFQLKGNCQALGQKCRTIYGMDTIEDTLCGLRFKPCPLLLTVSPHQAEQVFTAQAVRYAGLTGQELLLDLYCGAGTI